MVAERISKVLESRCPRIRTEADYKPAAVLVPLQERRDGDYLIFTQRSARLQRHSGQVAFPGGRVDPDDPGSLAAALRETHEEIGILPNHVQILGQLDQVTAAYNFLVTPYVGLVPFPYEFRLNLAETAAVFAVPVAELLKRGCLTEDGFFSSNGEPIYHFRYDGWDIWGATARILKQFLELAYGFEP